ncbi:hypothetical protein F4604DRAFT_56856 [Suillus subluteus]|nr:hypothetical protein F4604DRAFT_56856 [Suillus subluteus]
MMSRYTIALNNHYQSRRKLHAVTWAEVQSGPSHALSWTLTCKVEGEVVGTATANQKSVAKEEAARIACERLGIN